jgi:hypothetical protein
MLKRTLMLAGALIALGGPAGAQTGPRTAPVIGDPRPDAVLTVQVGDGTVSGSRETPHAIAWRATYYPENAPPLDAGIWNEHLRRLELNGRKVLVRTVGTPLFSGKSFKIIGFMAAVTVVDAETLAPIWSEVHNPDGSTERYAFDGVHVERRLTGAGPQDKEDVRRFDTPIPAYDFNGPTFPLYLKALPLKLGYSGAMPAVGDPEHPLRSVPFKVVGRERIRAGTWGVVEAWVVECPDPDTGTLRFWFSDQVPYVIRMAIPARPGLARAVYDLVG